MNKTTKRLRVRLPHALTIIAATLAILAIAWAIRKERALRELTPAIIFLDCDSGQTETELVQWQEIMKRAYEKQHNRGGRP